MIHLRGIPSPIPGETEARARALCLESGSDPDLAIETGPGLDVETVPNWMFFLGEAREALSLDQ